MSVMSIASYADFLRVANGQPEPQRLLFVFTESDVSAESIEQTADAPQSGTLTPVMCVDKRPAELSVFTSLVEESCRTGQHWDIVFAAALAGSASIIPTSKAAEQAMKKMIDAIQRGAIGNFLAFNRAGELVQFS
jgi:hypothetical protein